MLCSFLREATLKVKARNIRLKIRSRHRFRLEPYPGDALHPARGGSESTGLLGKGPGREVGDSSATFNLRTTTPSTTNAPHDFFSNYVASAVNQRLNLRQVQTMNLHN